MEIACKSAQCRSVGCWWCGLRPCWPSATQAGISQHSRSKPIFNPSLRLRPCARRALDPPPFNRAQVLSEVFWVQFFSHLCVGLMLKIGSLSQPSLLLTPIPPTLPLWQKLSHLTFKEEAVVRPWSKKEPLPPPGGQKI